MIDDLHKRDGVKRYDHVDEYQRRAIAEEQPDGDYVAYDDYAALLARLEAVEKEREHAWKMVEKADRAHVLSVNSCLETLARAEKAEAERDDARRQALEEAAKVCDKIVRGFVYFNQDAREKDKAFAAAIRALAAQEGEGEGEG